MAASSLLLWKNLIDSAFWLSCPISKPGSPQSLALYWECDTIVFLGIASRGTSIYKKQDSLTLIVNFHEATSVLWIVSWDILIWEAGIEDSASHFLKETFWKRSSCKDGRMPVVFACRWTLSSALVQCFGRSEGVFIRCSWGKGQFQEAPFWLPCSICFHFSSSSASFSYYIYTALKCHALS